MPSSLERNPLENTETTTWTAPRIFCLSLLLGLILFALIFGNIVTRIFVTLVTLSMLNGYWIGASNVLATICGMLIAIPLAVPGGKACEGLTNSLFGLTGLTNRIVSIGVCYTIVIMIVTIILAIVARLTIKKKNTWRRADRMLGAGLGLIEGGIFGLLVIWALLMLQPIVDRHMTMARNSATLPKPNRMVRWVARAADSVEESAVGRAASWSNPLKEMRLMTIFTDAQQVLNDSAARERFVNHPTMKEIAQRPSILKAQEMLASMTDVVNFEDGLSDEELRRLMQDPRIPQILDESDLLADLAPIAGEIEKALTAARPQP